MHAYLLQDCLEVILYIMAFQYFFASYDVVSLSICIFAAQKVDDQKWTAWETIPSVAIT